MGGGKIMNTDRVLSLDKEQILKHVYYNPESKTGLTRIDKTRKRYAGKDAGSFCVYATGNRKGEPHMIRVWLGDRLYPVHRIIWFLINGEIKDEHVIDHIDGNPFNNKIENLREIHSHENARNAKMRKDNSTGFTGVFRKTDKGILTFVTGWYDNGVVKTKSFSTKKYGHEGAYNLAVEHRKYMLIKLNLKNKGYTDRHGT